MMLVDLVEKWLQTPGDGANLETLGFSITKPPLYGESGIPPYKSGFTAKSWLNYNAMPCNWFSVIYEDKVVVIQHGVAISLLAADPLFFNKLSRIMSHVVNWMICPICKAEIEMNNMLDQNGD